MRGADGDKGKLAERQRRETAVSMFTACPYCWKQVLAYAPE